MEMATRYIYVNDIGGGTKSRNCTGIDEQKAVAT